MNVNSVPESKNPTVAYKEGSRTTVNQPTSESMLEVFTIT
ncbi:DEHA2F26158p [Debaryomyces hansenii CBS767]|uniref:DEHA2F26158p n=1 Tax=Debaryomyces hansenii (strain ATCC 36239 / CBS 767 / BCRC 21394 / JCM 1990 / NBRC 0083 / IGC 2968) TaxID=284592 RepID=Q6BJZ4_DEBHA|nr:DEHA2F26158p [Debaryomyces hansenii CBS767]CAG89898.1 DEHA2F26158p [Debaryomyces hansenii CBS767]|eukprot:XP_461477.1 DEHA2F26158p [Debaryomyces hansenii CBS767]